jgi:DNA-directed RNA polymerase subunit RPC12/RpoP
MQIEYCDTCKKKLTEQDFADGHAIRAGNQTYCKECGSKIPQVPVVQGRGPGASGTRLSSPSTGVIRRTATPAHALRPPSSIGVGATHRPGSPPKGMAPTSPPKGVTHMSPPTGVRRTPPPGQPPGSPPAGVNRTIVPQQGQARGSSGTQHAANARPGSGGHARRSSPHNRVVGIAKPSGNTAMVWVSVIGVIVGVLAGVGIIALFLR